MKAWKIDETGKMIDFFSEYEIPEEGLPADIVLIGWEGSPHEPRYVNGVWVETLQTLAEVKTQGILKVKQIRQTTLDKYPKSTGISRIYLDNLFAAQKYLTNDVSLMATGQTPEQYLTVLGSKFGFPTALSFANYIISENLRLGAPDQTIPSAYDVECEYGSSMVAIQTSTTVEAVQTIIGTYIAYCQPVTGQ